MIEVSENGGAIVFEVRVVPRSSKSVIVGELNGALKIRLSSPPVDGAANKALIRLLAETFRISKSNVEIISGERSRTKQLRVSGISRADLFRIISG